MKNEEVNEWTDGGSGLCRGFGPGQILINDGGVHDLTTQTYDDRFWISDGSTVNIGDGVTINISMPSYNYPTTYIGIGAGQGFMNIPGTGQLIMDAGHATGLADSTDAYGELTMSGNAYLETAGIIGSQRGGSVSAISENATMYIAGGPSGGGPLMITASSWAIRTPGRPRPLSIS